MYKRRTIQFSKRWSLRRMQERKGVRSAERELSQLRDENRELRDRINGLELDEISRLERELRLEDGGEEDGGEEDGGEEDDREVDFILYRLERERERALHKEEPTQVLEEARRWARELRREDCEGCMYFSRLGGISECSNGWFHSEPDQAGRCRFRREASPHPSQGATSNDKGGNGPA